MLRELADLVDAVAAARPLVWVLEDLHWSDSSTVEALALIARRRAAARLLLIGTYRPAELLLREHPLKAAKDELFAHGHCAEVVLRPLADTAVAAYLARRVPGAAPPARVAAFVRKRSQGHPFFMAALTDYLIERGVLVGSAARRPGPLAAVASGVPEGVQGFIESQLARLSAAERRVLEAASVAGTPFQAASVAAAVGADVESVETICHALSSRSQFIEDGGAAEWPDGTVSEQYGFRHALYQEVLYAGLGAGQRAQRHLAIGRRKAAAYGECAGEIAAELARHFEQGRAIRHAAHHYRLAAEKAFRRHAYREGLAHAERGLSVLQAPRGGLDQPREELLLLLTLAHSLYFLGQIRETLERLLPHRERVDQVDDRALAGLYHFWLGHSYSYLSRYVPAREEAERVLHDAERSGDRPLEGRGRYLLARIAFGTSRFREGVAQGRRAAELLDRNEDWLWRGQSHWIVGVNCYHLGEIAAAIEANALARSIGEERGDLRLQAYADWGDGSALTLLGEFDAAIAACERAAALARDPFSLRIARGNLGDVYLERGQPARAIPLLEEAAALF
jgi:tetratricopeptide (TPR) repeat protein